MKSYKTLIFISIASMLLMSSGIRNINYSTGIRKNVCKTFTNDVLLYFVFVDSKETMAWTEFDIQSTLDSINIAVKWLNQKARENNISLRIKTTHFIGNPYTTIKKDLPMGTVEKTMDEGLKKGTLNMNTWTDAIAKRIGSTLNIVSKDGIPDIKNPKDKERLIAFLRDDYAVESVGLFFMVNNYYKEDISICLNTYSTENIEYAVVSYKYPAEIAHNVLALFGAAPLFKGPFRKNEKKIKLCQEFFPNDIMQEPFGKNVNSLEISEYTKHLIGWSESLDNKYNKLLTD